jgi:intracellular multiplication protein IcmE
MPLAATDNTAAYQQAGPQVQQMTQAMQTQIQTLIGTWQPTAARVMQVAPAATTEEISGGAGGAGGGPSTIDQIPPTETQLVPAGTVNYGQMIIEANSDIPGPVMAKIMSGPLAGGKAIGSFESTDDYLIIRFNLVNFEGVDLPANILALNPDTTLGGMATETDQRYWSRIILPAAAEFVSGFANSFAEADQSVTVEDGVIVSSRAGSSFRRGIGEGTARAGERLSDIFDEQGNSIKPLVRVAAGTPVGLFFVSSVMDTPLSEYTKQNPYAAQAYGMPGYGQRAGQAGTGVPITQFGAIPGYPGQNYGAPGYGGAYNPAGTGYNNPALSGSGITAVPGYGQYYNLNNR